MGAISSQHQLSSAPVRRFGFRIAKKELTHGSCSPTIGKFLRFPKMSPYSHKAEIRTERMDDVSIFSWQERERIREELVAAARRIDSPFLLPSKGSLPH
jgi:hypothetical protein